MARRVLVLGLGYESAQALERIAGAFVQAERAEACALLWLVPDAPRNTAPWMPHTRSSISLPHAETLPLPLDTATLRRMYYDDPLTRAWSGPNWHDWGERILTNRLHGVLAARAHLHRIYESVRRLANALATQEGGALNIYVLAHLHGPFAGGALLDVGFMVQERIARARGSYVYGLCLLPDVDGDPLISGQADKGWYQANAFAALRELDFVRRQPSFFNNYHAALPVEVYNRGLFDRGDCYIIGGEQGENAQPLHYEALLRRISRWVYLQSTTDLAAALPASFATDGVYSTFGLAEADHLSQQTAAQQQQIMLDLLHSVLGSERPEDQVEWRGQARLRKQIYRASSAPGRDYEQAYTQLRALAARGPGANLSVQDIDGVYNVMRTALLREETRFAREVDEQTLDARDEVVALLAGSWSQRGQTVRGLLAVHQNILSDLQSLIAEQRKAISQRERVMEGQAESITDARLLFEYARSGYYFMAARTLGIGILALLLPLFAAFEALLLALPVIMLGTLILLWLPGYYRRSRLGAAQSDFIDQQVQFAESQMELLRQRTRLDYLERMQALLRPLLQLPDGRWRAAALAEAILDAQQELYESNRRLTAPHRLLDDTAQESIHELTTRLTTLVRQASPVAIGTPENADDTGDADDTDAERVTAVLHHTREISGNRQLSARNAEELQEVRALVRSAQAKAQVMLAFDQLQLSTEAQSESTRMLGFINWKPELVEALRGEWLTQWDRLLNLTPAHSNGHQAAATTGVTLSMAAQPQDDEGALKRVVLLNLRRNLPLRALLNLDSWREAFRIQRKQQASANQATRYIYAAFFHPTRLGMAVPDVQADQFSELRQVPYYVMAFVLLLRWLDTGRISESLARELGVDAREPINYDELCSALQSDLSRLGTLLHDIQQHAANKPHDADATINALLQAIDGQRPRLSEAYADWEVWTANQLRDDIRMWRTVDPRTRLQANPDGLRLLAQMYAYVSG
jgi:hypothetical protein